MFNIGSITKIEIAPSDQITLGTPNATNEVTVTNSGTWDEPSFTIETASWSEDEKSKNAGNTYVSKLKYQVPKVDPANYQAAHKYKNVPVVVRITDGNSNKVVIGTPDRPVFITTSKSIPEKTAGINAYQFEVNFESPHPAYFSA